MLNLKTPISKLFMVGPTYARRLRNLNIKTVEDLLYHFPHRYEDFTLISPIAKLQAGEKSTIQGKIIALKEEYTKYGKRIQKGIVTDDSGQIEITWFNQPFLIKSLQPGTAVSLSGKVGWFGSKLVLVSPDYEAIKNSAPIHSGRIVPVYPETYGISSKWLRSRIFPLIYKVVPELAEYLPSNLIEKYRLMALKEALTEIHFPATLKEATRARERLAFEELYLMHLNTQKRKQAWLRKKLAYQFRVDQEKISKFIKLLPFELTAAQRKVAKEILADLEKKKPMNRLLEGDVGSGKTAVAAIAIYTAILNRCQAAFMAPTEILANQHYKTLKTLLDPLGVKTFLLTGSTGKKETDFDLIIGTHALIHKRAEFKKLGLAIIDEQHRFGVEQRSILIRKSANNLTAHLLTMTATPIPRTIALTLYGDLDLSIIDQLPPGRIRIKTWVVSNQKRTAAYSWIRQKIKEGDQAFIICPLIEESQAETLSSVKAVSSEFKNLQTGIFPDLKLGLLHGRMKAKEKDKVLTSFRTGKINILVSTPVVEVGIDIPNATIMLIEAADRFGLAQLHQLRGRVGRGRKQSYCLLFSEKSDNKPLFRLKSMEKIFNGPELAEIDFKMRGPGELYGAKQHGFVKLKLASFSDLKLVEVTREEAKKTITELSHHPLLQEKLKEYTIKQIEPN
ncbi:MAG TPA: ATP-dependent DNA helicase RecG [Candidatus Bathyarchaeia archaeon]|nr:ATP-dependent DNA helicase RecG [Candidatus Bathyarchaeia archaeon]